MEVFKKQVLKRLVITIERVNGNDLELSDGGTTYARRNDHITWEIGAGSGVAAITGIYWKRGDDVFVRRPRKKPLSTSWAGRIKDEPQKMTEEYSIGFKKTPDGNEIIYDPIIQVNS